MDFSSQKIRGMKKISRLAEIKKVVESQKEAVRKLSHNDLNWLIEQAEEARKLKEFYDYFAELYGKGLEVANWHMNGELEPFDNFFDCAEEEMN